MSTEEQRRCLAKASHHTCDCKQDDFGLSAFSTEQAVEQAIVNSVFPNRRTRRFILKHMGATTILAALAQVFPIEQAAEAFAADETPEKSRVKIGFVPITCASPLIMAQPAGIYSKHGLNVELIKTPSWPAMQAKAIEGLFDAAHMVAPMPLSLTLGLDGPPLPYTVPAVQNVNGLAITLSAKHKNNRDPKGWKGFRLGVSYEYSMHNYLLRYYLAEHGVDPDTDLEIRPVPPPQMVLALKAGALDGFLGPDPAPQRAVYDGAGFIHLLSKEIWDRHPCCVFAMSKQAIAEFPKTHKALLKAIFEAAAFASQAQNRKPSASVLALPPYLNQPETVVEQVLTGVYDDGLGQKRTVPDRIDFDAYPWESFGVWILTQMKRWGQIRTDVTYSDIAKQVFLATDAAQIMKELAIPAPPALTKEFRVMGKLFNPEKPQAYLKTFAIGRPS